MKRSFLLLGFKVGTLIKSESSTLWRILVMVSITSTGYFPTEVSPLSITASAPSNTAFATSFTSARVGVILLIMLSIIWVATITGILLSLAFAMSIFWY